MTKIEKNIYMAQRTTFRIGGPARMIVYPETEEEISEWIVKEETKFILGGGSNLLVSDKGIAGAVLSVAEGFRDVAMGEMTQAQCGVSLSKLSQLALRAGLSGLEFAYGIPGQLGGALKMNAGAHGMEMKNIVNSVTLVTKEGETKTIGGDECGFDYRSSVFPDGSVLTSATLKLVKGEPDAIDKKMKEGLLKRKTTQPLKRPSAGSIFKNPEGDYAGGLIEKAGLKGSCVGQAMVSDKHANFIVNMGSAKAADVITLMERIEGQVYAKSGVRLVREIKLVGEF